MPPEAVSVAAAPVQMMPSFGIVPDASVSLMEAVGNGFTVMVVETEAVQLFAFVTVTVYVVVIAGVTAITAVIAPVLQI